MCETVTCGACGTYMSFSQCSDNPCRGHNYNTSDCGCVRRHQNPRDERTG